MGRASRSIPTPIAGASRGRASPGTTRSLRAACRRLHAGRHVRGAAREARSSCRARRDRDRDHAGRAISADGGAGATTASALTRPTRATAAPRTSRPSSTPRIARGIAVLLDVVYNHFGPEGNYLLALCARLLHRASSDAVGRRHQFRRPERAAGPRFLHRERANTGSRSFAWTGCASTRSMRSRTTARPDILDEIAERVRSRFDRPVHLLLENEDNEPARLRPDDRRARFTTRRNGTTTSHHVLHVAATGRNERLLRRLWRDTKLLGRALAEGFAYQGEMMPYRGRPRGGPSAASAARRAFVAFIQNHDQIGNRAFGERLSALAPPQAVRALASVYLLCRKFRCCSWARSGARASRSCSSAISTAIWRRRSATGGARSSRAFPNSPIPGSVAQIPDPLAETTFLASKLDWAVDRPTALALLSRRARRAPRACAAASAGDRARRRQPTFSASRRSGSSGAAGARGSCSTPTFRGRPRRLSRAGGRCLLALRRDGRRASARGACAGASSPA